MLGGTSHAGGLNIRVNIKQDARHSQNRAELTKSSFAPSCLVRLFRVTV